MKVNNKIIKEQRSGLVTIPFKIRKKYNISPGDYLAVYTKRAKVFIRQITPEDDEELQQEGKQ